MKTSKLVPLLMASVAILSVEARAAGVPLTDTLSCLNDGFRSSKLKLSPTSLLLADNISPGGDREQLRELLRAELNLPVTAQVDVINQVLSVKELEARHCMVTTADPLERRCGAMSRGRGTGLKGVMTVSLSVQYDNGVSTHVDATLPVEIRMLSLKTTRIENALGLESHVDVETLGRTLRLIWHAQYGASEGGACEIKAGDQ